MTDGDGRYDGASGEYKVTFDAGYGSALYTDGGKTAMDAVMMFTKAGFPATAFQWYAGKWAAIWPRDEVTPITPVPTRTVGRRRYESFVAFIDRARLHRRRGYRIDCGGMVHAGHIPDHLYAERLVITPYSTLGECGEKERIS